MHFQPICNSEDPKIKNFPEEHAPGFSTLPPSPHGCYQERIKGFAQSRIKIIIIIIIIIIMSEYFNRITLQCNSTVINGFL